MEFFQEFIQALFIIFTAELGDKTQIMALTFATQFSVLEVLVGVFFGVFANHGIAVALGSVLSSCLQDYSMYIQILAGTLFIFFGLSSLKDECDDEECNKTKKCGPILTVALAFFIGELGDKTQLTAITLSFDTVSPIATLLGTVTGMILVSGVGIIIGRLIGDKIPKKAIKVISAIVFITFGIIKLRASIPVEYLTLPNVIIFFAILGYLVDTMLKKLFRKDN